MEDYQQRVIDEESALDKKIIALGKFIYGLNPTFNKLLPHEQEQLKRQYSLMQSYRGVLLERIWGFGNTD